MGFNAKCRFEVLDVEHRSRKLVIVGELRVKSEEARWAINENGNPSGNEGSWRTIEADLRFITLQHPGLVVMVEMRGDDCYMSRVYATGGGTQQVAPKVQWPEPDESQMVPKPVKGRAKSLGEITIRSEMVQLESAENYGLYQQRWYLSRGSVEVSCWDSEFEEFIWNKYQFPKPKMVRESWMWEELFEYLVTKLSNFKGRKP